MELIVTYDVFDNLFNIMEYDAYDLIVSIYRNKKEEFKIDFPNLIVMLFERE